MKLYTESQIRKAIELSRVNNFGDDFKRWLSHSEPDIIAKLTPIELPSEKEIAEKIVNIVDTPEYGKLVYAGALWMLEQIKQQEKDGIV